MDYMILINEESKPVLVEPVDGSKFKFYQFKDEAFAMELVRKLSNNENDFFGVGQTFPLPDNIIVSFEYLCNCQLQTLRGTPTMCFTCLRPGEHKLAILSKLDEEKTGTPKSRNRPAPPDVAPSEEVKQETVIHEIIVSPFKSFQFVSGEALNKDGLREMIKADINDAIEKQEQEQREEYHKGREDAMKYCLELLKVLE